MALTWTITVIGLFCQTVALHNVSILFTDSTLFNYLLEKSVCSKRKGHFDVTLNFFMYLVVLKAHVSIPLNFCSAKISNVIKYYFPW